MPFAKVDTQLDLPAQERAILAYWQQTDAFEKLRAKNRGKPKWSFLDGPITANNPMGVHHAWGRTYKDVYQRYQAMTGHELRYQNGFDCQGLWVEVEVEKDLKLRSKRDIENLVPGDSFASIDKFVQLCKQRVDTFARRQTEQSIRLGYWMDWDRDEDWQKPAGERRSYYTMSEENNYTIWTFLKKCHERGLVYKSYDAMPWCGRCGTGISQQEMTEGYQLVAHRSVFVKFPLRAACSVTGAAPQVRENLLIWTTTPWTLTSNVGAAVNPTLTYLKVKHKDEFYYVAKGAFIAHRLEEQFKRKEWIEGVPKLKTLEQLFKEKGGYEIVGELPGKDMVGWQYDGPFDELPAQQHPFGYPQEIADVVANQNWAPSKSSAESHRVVAWPEVGETEGTGIVHIAPGCGKEDFHLARKLQKLSLIKELVVGGILKTRKDIAADAPVWTMEQDVPSYENFIAFNHPLQSTPIKNGEGLPSIAPLDDSGVFLDGFGGLTGRSANDPAVTDWILDDLQKKDRLFALEKYPHSYPHCWRCKNELLFRLVDEWFISMDRHYVEDGDPGVRTSYPFRARVMKVVEDVTFLPESMNGKARELDWLSNMGDWMISKKRFWGLALPIWVDEETGDFEVIGSFEELKERAVEGWDDFAGHTPHRPWIDLVKIRNPKTGNLMLRIPDVGNPWLDAGIVPFSTMKYNTDRHYWEQWFPADFITESFPGQFRNWFYALLAMSTMMVDRAPFKVLLGHGLVRDEHGDEMHKSKGNAIPFEGAADTGYDITNPHVHGKLKAFKEVPGSDRAVSTIPLERYPPIGSDLMRWMFCRNNPAANINFGPGHAEEIRSKFTMKLWNCYAFFCNYARLDHFDPTAPQVPVQSRPDIDRWILSDLQKLIKTAHEAYQNYDVQSFCLEAEDFIDNRFSNWYIRRNRRRFWKSDKGQDKTAAYQTLYTVLMTLTKLLAPVVPFLTETLYQNLKAGKDNEESVHLCEFPQPDDSLIDAELSADMHALLRLVSLGLAVRSLAKRNVRQPLAELRIQAGDERDRRAVERFTDQICDEVNLKKVTLHDPATGPLLRNVIKPNMKNLGPKFGPRLRDVQAALAAADGNGVVAKVSAGEAVELAFGSETFTLAPADVIVECQAEEGWAGLTDRQTQLALDTRVTVELELEGLAREVVRHVQNTRKDADLDMQDRIALALKTDGDTLRRAIDMHRDYIGEETLVSRWADALQHNSVFTSEAKIKGQIMTIQLHKDDGTTPTAPPEQHGTAGPPHTAAPPLRSANSESSVVPEHAATPPSTGEAHGATPADLWSTPDAEETITPTPGADLVVTVSEIEMREPFVPTEDSAWNEPGREVLPTPPTPSSELSAPVRPRPKKSVRTAGKSKTPAAAGGSKKQPAKAAPKATAKATKVKAKVGASAKKNTVKAGARVNGKPTTRNVKVKVQTGKSAPGKAKAAKTSPQTTKMSAKAGPKANVKVQAKIGKTATKVSTKSKKKPAKVSAGRRRAK